MRVQQRVLTPRVEVTLGPCNTSNAAGDSNSQLPRHHWSRTTAWMPRRCKVPSKRKCKAAQNALPPRLVSSLSYALHVGAQIHPRPPCYVCICASLKQRPCPTCMPSTSAESKVVHGSMKPEKISTMAVACTE